MNIETLIKDALCSPTDAITYSISQRLASWQAGRAMLEGDDCSFDLETYAEGGECAIRKKPFIHSQAASGWCGPGEGLWERAENAWYEVEWQGHSLEVLFVSWIIAM